MRAVIRSSSMVGQKAQELIVQELGIEVVAFVEPIHLAKDKKMVKGIPVVSQYQAYQMYRDGQFEKYVIPGNLRTGVLEAIESELKGFEIKEQDIVVIPSEFMDKTEWTAEEKKYVANHHEFRCLRYLEFHVADHCNLNCDNCSHFSPMVKGEVFSDYEIVKTDLLRLKELVDNIGIIRIMGGGMSVKSGIGKIYPISKKYISI